MADVNSIYPVLFILESILAFCISGYIIKNDSRYYLNRIFSIVVLCFGIYFLGESLIYLLQPEEFLANLFRDFSLGAALFGAYMFFLASIFLWFGKDFNPNIVYIMSAVVAILIGLAVLNDWVRMPITDTVVFMMTDPEGTILINYMPALFIVLSSFTYFRLYFISEGAMKRKLVAFLISILSILVAILYYTYYIDFGISDELGEIADSIGMVFYSIGLISLLIAFWKKKDTE